MNCPNKYCKADFEQTRTIVLKTKRMHKVHLEKNGRGWKVVSDSNSDFIDPKIYCSECGRDITKFIENKTNGFKRG